MLQVIEFVQFKERLQHSYQYLVARVEAPILQLKQNADNIEEEEVICFATSALYSMCHLVLHQMVKAVFMSPIVGCP